MTSPEGSGSVKTYLTGGQAIIKVDADLRVVRSPAPPADDVNTPALNVLQSGFDMEDYLVIGGEPSGLPMCQVRLRSRAGIGAWIYTDAPPAPADVNTGATCRWLPDTNLSPDGTSWLPTFGGDLELLADIGPYLDGNYSFLVRGGDEVSLPAVIFAGDSAMRLDDTGWSAAAFTFVLVAVLHTNPEGPRYGLFESNQQVDLSQIDPSLDPSAVPTDWSLRFSNGRVELAAGSRIASHQVSQALGRPVMVAVSMDSHSGKLFVCDRTKSSLQFATAGLALFDIQLLLGQTSTGGPNETAYMDVLDFSYFDRALSFAELAEQLHYMDSIYGIVN